MKDNKQFLLFKCRYVTGAVIATGVGLAATAGASAYGAHQQKKAANEQAAAQERANALQQEQAERQRKREVEAQKRENDELMNAISNLSNTGFSGAGSTSLTNDKYGDMG